MSIVLISPERDATDWVTELKSLRPTLDIGVYPGDSNRSEARFALTWRHPYGIFKEYPNLLAISSMGAGVDHLLRDPELPAGVPIVRLIDDALTSDMFEYVLTAIMQYLKSSHSYSNYQSRKLWKPHRYKRITDVQLGIMGMGAIGSLVAKRLKQLGFNVNGWARTQRMDNDIKVFHGEGQLEDFLSVTTILICLLPLTNETRDILNKTTLKKLPAKSYLINAGRGELLVEEDLLDLIDTGHLDGATLDVFRQEPLPENHPFWSNPGITITPHVASVTSAASCAPQILENYDRAIGGRPLLNLVSKEKGY